MKKQILLTVVLLVTIMAANAQNKESNECSGGWAKYEGSPVLGGDLGTIFDISVLRNNSHDYKMYCSWRPKKSIALSESKDGLTWSVPEIVLAYNDNSSWEKDLNRPVVVMKDGIFHMWYTGQADGHSWIGYATSKDGKNWIRQSDKPVVSAELSWEKVAVMCPHVNWDEQEQLFKMWYSGGEQYEPDAIGYATSKDGLNWTKYKNNPVFANDKNNKWEQSKIAGCQIIKRKNDYLMFYIGYENVDYAQIGMARSKDGISNWERFKDNPIVKPGAGWDASAVYKPYAVADPENNRWLLYYNGRNNSFEQIGIVIHKGMDLGF